MTDSGIPSEAEVWAQLERHVARTRGSVGIEKMLGGRSSNARGRWTRAAVDSIRQVAAVTSAYNRSDVEFRFGGNEGVDVILDISEVQVRTRAGRLSTILWRPAAAVVLGEWAYTKWGDAWTSTLDSLVKPRDVLPIDESEFFPGLHYVAQDPSGAGPYLSASSEAMARRGGQAEDLGDAGVADAVAQLIARTELTGWPAQQPPTDPPTEEDA